MSPVALLLNLISLLSPTVYCGHDSSRASAPTMSVHLGPVQWTTEQRFVKPYYWGNQYFTWVFVTGGLDEIGPGATLTWCASDDHMRHLYVGFRGVQVGCSGCEDK